MELVRMNYILNGIGQNEPDSIWNWSELARYYM